MSKILLDPQEEYIILPVRVVEKLVRYALTLCQDRCPTERDPETCIYLVKLCKLLGLGGPPCLEEYENFSPMTFRTVIKDIERKYGMRIEEFLRRMRSRGPRSLEENTDLMEAEFALGVMKAMSKKVHIYVVKGSEVRISIEKETKGHGT
ncbi:MAG: hypothetical protein GXO26_04920 [Crenarchaeota archaeon]|nr:hypothetical protein [Thermoproteota archaeon]